MSIDHTKHTPCTYVPTGLLTSALLHGAALALLILLSGCVHELKFLPQCEGAPANNYPCLGACRVQVPSPAAPGLVVRVMPNALVITDERGIVRCMEVAS